MHFKKPLILVLAIVATACFCEWPNFHPEHYLGANYAWWLDMIFHGGYYFVMTIFLYMVFCKGRHVGLFWITVLVSSYLFEAVQALVPGRTASVLDLISNFLGISAATLICSFFYRSAH